MFYLILIIIFLPFYMFYFFIKVFAYIIIFTISLIKLIFEKRHEKVHEDYMEEMPQILESDNYNIENSDLYNIRSNNNYNKLYINPIKPNKKECLLIQLTDTELRATVEKIQELYKKNGFDVKVIDIKKKKYTTEYEIIFSRENTQYEVLSISNKIIENFSIDGFNITRNTKN